MKSEDEIRIVLATERETLKHAILGRSELEIVINVLKWVLDE